MALFLASPVGEPRAKGQDRSWWVSLFALCAILGALFGLSFKTQNAIRRLTLPSTTYSGLAEGYTVLNKRVDDDQRTIGALQLNIAQLEQALVAHPGQERVLETEVKSADFLAGLTPVTGPGIIVTMNDSKKKFPDAPTSVQALGIIHDTDINQVANELKAAGAEAVAVNAQRLVGMTPIRCAGPTIFVNNVPETPPYLVSAIGDPKTLQDAMNLPGGVVDGFSSMDPAMISVARSAKLVLPAYQGPTQPKYARAIDPAKESGSGLQSPAQ